jgi:hypothetical protein
MGPTTLLPLQGSLAADFYRFKNPLPSAEFEPVNVGSNVKHANYYTTEDNLHVHKQ